MNPAGWLAAMVIAATASGAYGDAQTRVFAAGSLRPALTPAAAAFKENTGADVHFEFGASGLLRERLEHGEHADLFASANMEHPREIASRGLSGPAQVFARNRLCALAAARLNVTPANVLERMLEPAVKLGTSTPKIDPSGDYAWQVFERAEKVRPGAFELLSKKALQLTGGAGPMPVLPPGRTLYGLLMQEGRADIFLTYCTNAELARREVPSLHVVALPPELAVSAEYGLVVMKGATATGEAFAQFVLGPLGQRIFAEAGFAP